MGTTENDGCIERLGAIRASYRVDGQAHAQADTGWPTTPDLNDEGKRAAHEDIHEEDWADPGVVVWLLRQGAVVPQRRVRCAAALTLRSTTAVQRFHLRLSDER